MDVMQGGEECDAVAAPHAVATRSSFSPPPRTAGKFARDDALSAAKTQVGDFYFGLQGAQFD